MNKLNLLPPDLAISKNLEIMNLLFAADYYFHYLVCFTGQNQKDTELNQCFFKKMVILHWSNKARILPEKVFQSNLFYLCPFLVDNYMDFFTANRYTKL